MKKIKILLLLITFGIILFSCGDPEIPKPPKPKYDKNLSKPDITGRLSQSYEQIEYWESNDSSFTITEKTDSSIKSISTVMPSLRFKYEFKKDSSGRNCSMVSMVLESHNKKETAKNIELITTKAIDLGYKVDQKLTAMKGLDILLGSFDHPSGVRALLMVGKDDNGVITRFSIFKADE
jgi:hypothetical protein